MGVDPVRRDLLKAAAVGTTALSVPQQLKNAVAEVYAGDIARRTISGTREEVPAIGLGSHMTFNIEPSHTHQQHQRMVRYMETMPAYPGKAFDGVIKSPEAWSTRTMDCVERAGDLAN